MIETGAKEDTTVKELPLLFSNTTIIWQILWKFCTHNSTLQLDGQESCTLLALPNSFSRNIQCSNLLPSIIKLLKEKKKTKVGLHCVSNRSNRVAHAPSLDAIYVESTRIWLEEEEIPSCISTHTYRCKTLFLNTIKYVVWHEKKKNGKLLDTIQHHNP